MLSIYDNDTLAVAQHSNIDPRLKELIVCRLGQAECNGLGQLTHILVIEADDTEQQIIDEIRCSPLANPLDGIRYGEPGFIPHWAWLQDSGAWFEMIVTVGDSGFAYIILIEKAAATSDILRTRREAVVAFAGRRKAAGTTKCQLPSCKRGGGACYWKDRSDR